MAQSNKEYHRNYYHTVLKPKRRKERYGGLKCQICEIRLEGVFGAHSSKRHCKSCIESGAVKRRENKLYYQRYKEKVLKAVTEYQKANREYVSAYHRQWRQGNATPRLSS